MGVSVQQLRKLSKMLSSVAAVRQYITPFQVY